jgi:hypothetical protein
MTSTSFQGKGRRWFIYRAPYSDLIATVSAVLTICAGLMASSLAQAGSGIVVGQQGQIFFQDNLGRTRESGSSVLGVFVGSTPCDELPRQFLGIPANSPCERITWQLTLLTHQDTRLPITYKLASTYGMQAQSAPGFVGGGTTVELQGTCATVKGTKANPDAMVYQLNADKPQRSVSFVKVGDDLLHLLNREKSLMIGSASWSYTLNRKGKGRDS